MFSTVMLVASEETHPIMTKLQVVSHLFCTLYFLVGKIKGNVIKENPESMNTGENE